MVSADTQWHACPPCMLMCRPGFVCVHVCWILCCTVGHPAHCDHCVQYSPANADLPMTRHYYVDVTLSATTIHDYNAAACNVFWTYQAVMLSSRLAAVLDGELQQVLIVLLRPGAASRVVSTGLPPARAAVHRGLAHQRAHQLPLLAGKLLYQLLHLCQACAPAAQPKQPVCHAWLAVSLAKMLSARSLHSKYAAVCMRCRPGHQLRQHHVMTNACTDRRTDQDSMRPTWVPSGVWDMSWMEACTADTASRDRDTRPSVVQALARACIFLSHADCCNQ